MDVPPTLRGARLTLRPFVSSDAPALQRLAADEAIARTTLSIPHPYPPGAAAAWIAAHPARFREGQLIQAVVAGDETLVGCAVLKVEPAHDRAELGYWIGVPFWGRGYASEAARLLVDYGFQSLQLNRVFAAHFAHNAASGRVLAKLGMAHEGVLRQHVKKWDRHCDIIQYGLLREAWLARTAGV